MFLCGTYRWLRVTIVCVVVYTVHMCDMYGSSRHNTCVSGSSVSGGRFSAVTVRRLFYHGDREVSVGCWCSSGGGSVSWWGEKTIACI